MTRARRLPSLFSGILVAIGALLLLMATAADAADSDQLVLHVLNRLAFGPSLDDFAYVKAVGVERYIAEQLDPANIPEPFELRLRLAGLGSVGLDAVQLRHFYGPLPVIGGVKPTLDELRERQRRAALVVREAAAARVLRAVMSRRQLEQVMVNFWFNHFNIFAGDGLERIWIGNYENQAIRPHALGRFRDLLFAVAKHPAMLAYLDNTQNIAVRGTAVHRLNENFARELMELHTLGADGGYTQDDVETLARVFTGWRVNRFNANELPGAAAIFEGAHHDYGPKVFLGRNLQAHGKAEGEEALDILASNPATARHIAFELAQYFVADAPPVALVDRLATRFLATGGNIGLVLKTLFASNEFLASAGQKYKTPYEFVVSAARASGSPMIDVAPLLAWMRRLGMPLYGCPTPDGYHNTAEAWLSPEATIQRIAIAAAIAAGAIRTTAGLDGVFNDNAPPRRQPVDPDHLLLIFGSSLTAQARALIRAAAPRDRAALILGSPDFMRR